MTIHSGSAGPLAAPQTQGVYSCLGLSHTLFLPLLCPQRTLPARSLLKCQPYHHGSPCWSHQKMWSHGTHPPDLSPSTLSRFSLSCLPGRMGTPTEWGPDLSSLGVPHGDTIGSWDNGFNKQIHTCWNNWEQEPSTHQPHALIFRDAACSNSTTHPQDPSKARAPQCQHMNCAGWPPLGDLPRNFSKPQ